MEDISLHLSKEFLDKMVPIGEKEYKKNFPDEEEKQVVFPDIRLNPESVEFDSENTISICGAIYSKQFNSENTECGWFSFNIPIGIDNVIDIIETYRKKLGKLKTVLEATKD